MQRNELQKLKVFAFGLKKPSIKQTTCRLWNPQWHQTEDMDSFQNCGEIEDGHPTRIQWIFEENAAPFGCLGQHGAASDSMLRNLKTPWAPCGTANHLAAGSLGQMEVHGCSRVVQWVLLYYLPRCVLERVAQWSDAQAMGKGADFADDMLWVWV